MGVSETIIAAAIGAGATLITALVQVMANLRAQSKSDFRPKRDRTLRSMIAIVVLMMASGASGYLYAEYRNATAAQDLRAMRDEINAQLQALTMTTERLAASRNSSNSDTTLVLDLASKQVKSTINNVVAEANTQQANTQANPAANSLANTIEATIYVAGCTANCTEATAQIVPVCGSMPSESRVEQIDLYVAEAGNATTNVANQLSFEQVQAEREFNATKFGALPVANNTESKALCVEFKHWSDKPHFARAAWRIREPMDLKPGDLKPGDLKPMSPLRSSDSAGTSPLATLEANSVATLQKAALISQEAR